MATTTRTIRPPRLGGALAGRLVVTAGLGRVGGAQSLAAAMSDATALVGKVDPQRFARRLSSRHLGESADSLDEALSRVSRYTRERMARSVGLRANAADVLPALVRPRRDARCEERAC